MSSMDVKNKIALAVGVGAALLSAAAAYKFYMKSSQWQKKNSKQLVKGWKAVGTVAALNIFPIKSCKGIPVDEAECMTLGLANERLQDRLVNLDSLHRLKCAILLFRLFQVLYDCQ